MGGHCPDWFSVVRAAHFYSCKPWELVKELDPYWHAHPIWIEWAEYVEAALEDLKHPDSWSRKA